MNQDSLAVGGQPEPYNGRCLRYLCHAYRSLARMMPAPRW
jgi:hypothetical protein